VHKQLRTLYVLLFVFFAVSANAQLVVNNTPAASNGSPTWLVQNVLLGNGVTAFNVTFKGDSAQQIGFFNGSSSNIGLQSGVILSTGKATGAVGPNTVSGTTTAITLNNPNDGDADLALLANVSQNNTRDRAILEFDFIPVGDSVIFKYVFASEEYSDYVCSNFNDVFGFFISGPGITGPFSNSAKNIALIPGSNTPVSINNVNAGRNTTFGTAPTTCTVGGVPCPCNSSYFVNNEFPVMGTTVQYDGFTKVLEAREKVECGKVYHIKLAVSDVFDESFDSGVFLAAESFTSPGVVVSVTTVTGDSTILEGCADATFTFTRPDTVGSVTVNYTIGGTATNGVDYNFVPGSVTIPSGQTTATVTISPVADGITEPVETVIFTVYNVNACGDTIVEGDTLYIDLGYVLPMSANNATTNCSGDTVAISATASGGTTPYNYTWSTGQNGQTVQVAPLQTDTFFVTATDFPGCPGIDTVIVTVQNPLPVTDAGNNTSVCLNDSVQIGGSPTGPAGSTYIWSPGATLSSSTIANPYAKPTVTTKYYVTVTDVNGCKNIDSITVNVLSLPTADAGTDKQVCSGSSVQIGGSPTGPVGATYDWAPSGSLNNSTSSNPFASPTVNTTYIVTITIGTNCKNTDTVNVTVNPLPVAAISNNDTTICSGESVQLNASGGITYSWSPVTGLNNPSISNPVATPATTTTYTVSVTDNNNCTDTKNIIITVNNLPVTDAGNNASICINGSIQIGGTPTAPAGSTYNWIPSGTLDNSTIANPTATPVTTTTYYVTATGTNGCSNTDSIVVTVNNLPFADAGTDKSICFGSSVQIGGNPTGPGGSTFNWAPSGSINNSSIANPTASPTVNTTYIVIVTDANNCSNTDTVNITVNSLPVATASNDTTICAGFSVQLSATGGNTYAWSPSAGLNNPAIFNPIATPSNTTMYIVTVTDLNNCTDTESVIITVNQLPNANAGPDTAVCFGGSIQIGGSPTGPAGSTYNWSPLGSLDNSTIANPTATPSATTPYIVTVTDANNCENKDTIVVTVNPLPIVNAGPDKAICQGGSTVIGGTPTVTGAVVLWSPSSGLNNIFLMNPTASPSSTTTYIVNAADNKGCINKDTVIVTVNPNPVADAGLDVAICIGDTALLNGTGGGIYNWSPAGSIDNNAISNPKAFPVTTTKYYLTVTNGFNCTNTDSVTVTVNSLPNANAGPDAWVCPGDSIQLSASGGVSYFWSPSTGLSNPNISNPKASPPDTIIYIVTVTDANGCVNTDTIKLDRGPVVPTIAGGPVVTICLNDSVQIGGAPTGPPNTLFSWSPVTGLNNASLANPMASPATTTTYYVNTQNFNCTGVDSIQVVVNNLPNASAGTDTAICIGDTIQLNASGGTGYIWFPSSGLSSTIINNPLAFPSATTTYFVTVTDANSCANTDSIVITVNSLPVIVTSSDTSICINDTIQISASGGTSYSWSPPAGLSNTTIANPLTFTTVSTTYYVFVTDANMCSNTDSVIVLVNQPPVISIIGDTSVCINDTIQLFASGGTSYNWSPSTSLLNPTSSNPFAFPVTDTKYYVTVTDGNTCSNTDSVNVVVNPLPVINAGSDVSVCLNDSVQLIASGGSSYVWSPVSGLSSAQVFNPKASPSSDITYYVTGTDVNGCSNTDSVTVTVNALPNADAGPNVSSCPGDSIQLNASGGVSYLWSPSTGLSSNSIQNPLVLVGGTTIYYVEVTDANGCKSTDSVFVQILSFTPANAGNDTFICVNDAVQLNASGGVIYNWSPATGLSDATIANPIANPANTTIYTVSVSSLTNNLVVNGDFESGNVSFNSDYTFSNNLMLEGLYWVGDNANTVHPNFQGTDHTTGSGNFMVVNGAGTPGLNVWCQTVNVNPNTDYYFSTWVSTVAAGNPAMLQFSINGIPLGNVFNAPVTVGTWSNFFTTWNSGANTTAQICVVNQNTLQNGNDFGLDDITFQTLCTSTDSVEVTVYPLPAIIVSNDTAVCAGDSVQLNVSGGVSYNWLPVSGLNNSTSANPMASPAITTNYFVFGTDTNNCTNTDSVLVTIHPLPFADAGSDKSSCPGVLVTLGGNPTGPMGSSYQWSPSGLLNNSPLPNPQANINTTTVFYLTVTDTNSCKQIDSVVVNNFSITMTADTSLCLGDSVVIGVTAVSGTSPFSFQWTPVSGLNNATTQFPVVSPSTTTIYFASVTDVNGCSDVKPVKVLVHENPLADFSMELKGSCEDVVAEFINNSFGGLGYVWLFSDGSTSAVAEPVHHFSYNSPVSATLIVVNNETCSDTAYLSDNTLSFDEYFKSITIPNVFSPNNDGMNDWFEINFGNRLQDCTDLKIFNRWGELLFESRGSDHSWSGKTFSGQNATEGTYYYILEIRGKVFTGNLTLIR
jgi:gliding motility-associated-like protein